MSLLCPQNLITVEFLKKTHDFLNCHHFQLPDNTHTWPVLINLNIKNLMISSFKKCLSAVKMFKMLCKKSWVLKSRNKYIIIIAFLFWKYILCSRTRSTWVGFYVTYTLEMTGVATRGQQSRKDMARICFYAFTGYNKL